MGGVKKQCFNDIHKLLVNGNPEQIVLIEMNGPSVFIVYIPKDEVLDFYKNFRRDQGSCEVDIDKSKNCIELQVGNEKYTHYFENSKDIDMANDAITTVCETVQDDVRMIMRSINEIRRDNNYVRQQLLDKKIQEVEKLERIGKSVRDVQDEIEEEIADSDANSNSITDGFDINNTSRRSLQTNDDFINLIRNAENNHRSYNDTDNDEDNMYDDGYNDSFY